MMKLTNKTDIKIIQVHAPTSEYEDYEDLTATQKENKIHTNNWRLQRQSG